MGRSSFQEDGNETHNNDSKAEKEIVDAATVANISSIKPGIDHFDDEESNPVKSNAMSEYSFQFLIWILGTGSSMSVPIFILQEN